MTAIPRDPPASTPGLRTLGTTAVQAAAGNDSRFAGTGVLTIKASYIGTPGADVFYKATDLAGNVIQARTNIGVEASTSLPGLFTFDQVVSLDQFVASWDEDDGLTVATEVISTRHSVGAPSPPTSVVAVGGNTQATITFTPGDNGGAAITSYTVLAIDSTNGAHGGQIQDGTGSGIVVGGLTNGESYTFTVTATTSFGTSVASAASNSVVPAVVITVPDPPTNAQAVVSGSGQVTVTFTAPANNGGSAITSYRVSAIDETNSAHNTTHNGNSPNVVTGLVNGEVYHFTVRATNTIGNSVESAASNSVSPSGSGGVATFTYTQPTGAMVLLDATGSTGTLTWEVDGVAAAGTATTLRLGPLKIGSHHIKLTATSGGAGITERDIDVAWVARPFALAETDPTNGPTVVAQGYWGLPIHSHSATELPQWSAPNLKTLAPWRQKGILNMVEGYPGAGDGVSRITVFDDNHISLLTKTGDHPGTSGGYRSSFEWNHSYMATAGKQIWASGTTYIIDDQIRYGTNMYTSLQNANTNHQPDTSPTYWSLYSEAVELHDIDVTGQNVSNTGTIDGHSTLVRFYRISFKVPTGNPNPMLYQNNFYELFGVSDGAVIFGPNGSGTQLAWNCRAKVSGVGGASQYFDSANIQLNVWYDYVVEACFNTSTTVGYVRIYRDFGLGAGMVLLPPSRWPAGTKGKTDGTLSSSPDYGKLFYASQQTDNTGAPVKMQVDVQNYRDRFALDALYNAGTPYPDVTIEYKNCIVGPTLASVMI